MIMFDKGQTPLLFDEKNGYLKQIEYSGKTIPLCSKLWKIETNDGILEINDMTSFKTQAYSDMLKLFWENEKALVTVTLRAGDDGKIYWNINVDLFGGNGVNKVIFPLFEGLGFENDNYLLIGYQNGTLIKNPVDSLLAKNRSIT